MQAPRSSVVQFEIGSVNEIIEVVDNVLREDYVWKQFNLLTVMVEAHHSSIRESYQCKALLNLSDAY